MSCRGRYLMMMVMMTGRLQMCAAVIVSGVVMLTARARVRAAVVVSHVIVVLTVSSRVEQAVLSVPFMTFGFKVPLEQEEKRKSTF